MIESPIFTPCQIGPITLRNRTIRSAAFENMAVKNAPSEALFNYHTAVARGGIGMTTVAYASVSRSGEWERSKIGRPSSVSTFFTAADKAGWVIKSFLAAWEKLFSS